MQSPEELLDERSHFHLIYVGFDSITNFFANYGWYLLIFTIIIAYIYNTRLKSYLEKWKQRRDEEEYAAKYHKNPDLLQARLVAQQTYAEKLQEKYNKDAEEYKKKQEEREAKKRQEFLDRCNGEGGTRLGAASDNASKKSLRPEYHPLMGSGSSSNYKPPKRSKCSGGGCGR